MLRRILKLLRMIGLSILGIILVIVLIATAFLNLSPQFGQGPSKGQLEEYAKTGHHEDGKFVNLIETKMDAPSLKIMLDFFRSDPKRSPSSPIEPLKLDSAEIESRRGSNRLTWFGHSAFLLEMDGKMILLDPMFGKSPSPHPWLGTQRYSDGLPLEVDKLPEIDAVLFSHDHFDHLDYPTVKKIRDKVKQWFVPLGLDNHLESWGVDRSKIVAADWWESFNFEGIQFTSTPARHFSGRGLFDRNRTLWCSWVIEKGSNRIYFSGDGGYGPHFKEIGDKFGEFDLALMECGQYNEAWHAIHMMPEETVQAGLDVNAKRLMPIHWGGFTLALHAWTDPVVRAEKAALQKGIPLTTPQIGETVNFDENYFPVSRWWEKY